MSDGGELATIRAFANKAGEHVVRVAGVRTIYADADAVEIADAAVAIDLVRHYVGEVMRLRGMAGEGAHVLGFIKGIGRSATTGRLDRRPRERWFPVSCSGRAGRPIHLLLEAAAATGSERSRFATRRNTTRCFTSPRATRSRVAALHTPVDRRTA